MFDVWKNVLAEIEQNVSSSVFSTFFKDSSLMSVNNGTVVIGVNNFIKQKQFNGKYKSIIIKALEDNDIEVKEYICNIISDYKPTVKARETTSRTPVINTPKRISDIKSVVNNNDGLNSRYTMENFVVGSNNDLAVSEAKYIIENPGTKYNPFFLYGGPGLGKTHLVQAIGNAIKTKYPKLKVLYVTTNQFYSEFISLIRAGKGDDFSKKYRNIDVLIIDDFQFIVGKAQSQDQFFNIFNDMYNLNKQIIVTSDRLPSEIKTLDERLASRLTWAGAIDLQMPNFEDKCAILRSKADYNGNEIEDEAIEYIAENVKTNIRDLEGELSKIIALSDLRGLSPLELINEGYATPRAHGSRSISAKQIIDKVAKHYQLSVKEMCSKSRVSNIKTARQVAMYLLREELNMSFPKIAVEIGVKDHTTVMHGIKKIENDLKLNFGLREQIDTIRGKIYG